MSDATPIDHLVMGKFVSGPPNYCPGIRRVHVLFVVSGALE